MEDYIVSEDYLVRIIAKDAGVRGLACVSTGVANDGAQRHSTSRTASAALAHGLTGGILVGALLKVGQRVAIKWSGDGPLEKMVIESNNYGRVRGYVSNPNADLPPREGVPDVAAVIGREGLLTVVKDLGTRDLSEGIVAIETGLVDKELEHFMRKSEQTATLIEIGSVSARDDSLAAAGGVLVQALPGEHASVMAAYAEQLHDLPPVGNLLRDGESPEQILARVFSNTDYEILEKHPVRFQCNCSWRRSEDALLSLGRAELEALMAEGETVIDCHFCHEQYVFGEEAIETIIDKLPA